MWYKYQTLNPQADSLLFAAVLLLLQPIQIEEVDPAFQMGGLNYVPLPFVTGMYLQQSAVHIPAEFRGMGIRIEDDILITTDGYVNLSQHCPKHPDEIEKTCASA